MKTIVFATDFSATAHKAIDVACEMRNRFEAELHVVHVYDPASLEIPLPYGMMPGATEWIDEHMADMEKRGRKTLEELLPRLEPCTSHFLQGKPGPSIVALAHEVGADTIVMGTHGYKGFQRLLMGSVAEYVLRHTDCAVITVKDNPEK